MTEPDFTLERWREHARGGINAPGVRHQALIWSKLAPPDDWGDGPASDAMLADVGRWLLRVLDE